MQKMVVFIETNAIQLKYKPRRPLQYVFIFSAGKRAGSLQGKYNKLAGKLKKSCRQITEKTSVINLS